MPSKKQTSENCQLSKFINNKEKGIYQKVKYNKNKKNFYYLNARNKEVSLKGITTFLLERFWPKYETNYKRSFKKKKNKSIEKFKKGDKKYQKKSKEEIPKKVKKDIIKKIERGYNYGRDLDAKARGTLAHKQIEFVLKNGFEKFKKTFNYTDMYTHFALTWIKESGLDPVSSEFVVGDINSGLATSIDAVFCDKGGNIYIIEWKTGSRKYFEKWDDYMEFIEPHVENSALNRAKIQVAFSYVLMKRMSKTVSAKGLYVVHLSDDGYKCYKVEKKYKSLAIKILDLNCK